MSKRKIRKFDKEFKQNAVNFCLKSERSCGEIAEELGIPRSTLASWVIAHQKDGEEAFPGKGHLKPSDAEVAQLRKELSHVREEPLYIKKSAGHLLLTTKMKFEFMKNHTDQFSIEKMSQILNVSRSGYYQFIHAEPSGRSKEDNHLLALIKMIHRSSRGTYGSPRIHAELHSQGETCFRKQVARLMKKSGIEAKMKR